VEREVLEEAGKLVKARKLLAVYDRNQHGHPPTVFHSYKIFVLCDLLGEATASVLETSDPTFFLLSEMPELSPSRVTPEEISRMFEHLHDPSLPTFFD
jgi:ADP-ribose pyrophosphatase YjhB (NUDIX family)